MFLCQFWRLLKIDHFSKGRTLKPKNRDFGMPLRRACLDQNFWFLTWGEIWVISARSFWKKLKRWSFDRDTALAKSQKSGFSDFRQKCILLYFPYKKPLSQGNLLEYYVDKAFYKENTSHFNFFKNLKSRFLRFRECCISVKTSSFELFQKAASRYDSDLLLCKKLEILVKTWST